MHLGHLSTLPEAEDFSDCHMAIILHLHIYFPAFTKELDFHENKEVKDQCLCKLIAAKLSSGETDLKTDAENKWIEARQQHGLCNLNKSGVSMFKIAKLCFRNTTKYFPHTPKKKSKQTPHPRTIQWSNMLGYKYITCTHKCEEAHFVKTTL